MECSEIGLSVIIPLLMPDDEFMRAVYSVRSALLDRVDFELIVITRSNHVAAVRELVPWCKVVAESRRGIYGAMNDGVKVATGKYLYFMGKDDILLPLMSEFVCSTLESAPVAAFAAVYWGDRGVYAPVTNRYRILLNNTCHQGVLYSREVFLRYGGYVRRFKYQADHYLNMRLLWDFCRSREVVSYGLPVAWYSGSGESEQVADKNFGKYLPAMLDRYVGFGSGRALLALRLVKKWFVK